MSDRDRLIELIKKEVPRPKADALAGYLLANGVIVQKQGEWETTQEPIGWKDVECVECSACKEFWKYCPNCGARTEREGK